MSLATSLLLALLPAIVRPKLQPEKSNRERELERENRQLTRAIEQLVGELADTRAERDAWRARAIERIGERPPPEFNAAYQQQQMMAQMQAGQAMASSLAQAGLYSQAQNALGFGEFCNCVPARHEALFGGALGA